MVRVEAGGKPVDSIQKLWARQIPAGASLNSTAVAAGLSRLNFSKLSLVCLIEFRIRFV